MTSDLHKKAREAAVAAGWDWAAAEVHADAASAVWHEEYVRACRELAEVRSALGDTDFHISLLKSQVEILRDRLRELVDLIPYANSVEGVVQSRAFAWARDVSG